ncbi:MAG: FecR family protein [Bacteroidales bacterium]|jgi:ferric-dicitrate binding protein FerR (iron transport regulator)
MRVSIENAIRELLDDKLEVLSSEVKETLSFLFNTEEGKECFNDWFQSNSINSEEISGVDFEKMYSKISGHVNINVRKPVFPVVFMRKFQKIAALFIIPLVIGAVTFLYYSQKSNRELSNELAAITNYDTYKVLPLNLEYVSPPGARLKILLTDSTEVCLNGNSRLFVSRDFGRNERRVKLDGEAFFDVRRNEKQKFIVDAGAIDVIALGTSFYVQAYPSEKTIEAVLLRGKVAVEYNEQQIILEPNQKYTYIKENNKENLSKNIETKRYKAWTDGELIFENDTMEEIIRRLEHFYNVTIVVENPEIYSYGFTASLANCSIEQIMEYMKLSSPIDYKVIKNEIRLSSRK